MYVAWKRFNGFLNLLSVIDKPGTNSELLTPESNPQIPRVKLKKGKYNLDSGLSFKSYAVIQQ